MRELKSDVLVTNEKIQGEFFSSKKQDLKVSIYKKLDYMKKNYQLYLFFTLPPLLLLIIFKYIPIGGILIAFEDYNPISRNTRK